ncbi:hypothetical protein SAMN05518801_1612, partial [Novosphingobium sp. CF614]
MQEQCAQQLLRRDRWPANARIHRIEISGHHLESFVDERTDRPKWVVCRNPGFAAHVGKQPFAPVIAAAHLKSFNLSRRRMNHLKALKESAFFRNLLGRGRWDAEALRDIVRDYVVENLATNDAVLV